MFPVEEGPAKNPKVEEPNPTSPEDDLSVIIGCLKGITNQTAILALQEVADLYTKRAYAGEGGAGRMVKELLDAIALAIKKKENAQTNCELEKPTPQTVAAVVEKVATAAGSIEDFHESVAAMTINILTVQKTAESEEIVEEEEGGKDSDNKTKEETYQKIGTNSFDTLAYQVDSTAVAEATDFSEIEG